MPGGRPSRRVQAIVLARTKLAEQDLILTMLARDGSQVRAVAKGARKPGGRLASRTELFCESDLLISLGRSLGIITEASLVDAHASLRGDPERVAAASALLEVGRLSCFEDVEDAFLYPILARALRACEEANDQAHLDLVVAAYALKVLSHGGWRPELASCVACGDRDLAAFSVRMGGALCASCAKDVEDVRVMGEGEILWLRALIGLTFDELLTVTIDNETATTLLSVVHAWCAFQLDARVRSLEYLLGV